MRILFILFFFTGLIQGIYAQKISVYDLQTGIPVADAALYNTDKSHSAVSDENGIVDVSGFTNGETIFISHVAF